ncbi:alcohol dehydrogenase family protein [uncultured Roseobacter sp.]|uniref:alcohol dehydrogenase family protein n=1 Tax=uncultured Roseobacter sp. TaxID=114847 RepID=UPI00260745FD|nr:alcohol dehydrogenase family protein [uncultured Roseobacter sp.]
MTVPETMRAVVLTKHGGPEALELREDWPVPHPGPRDVLIRVGACGVNNTDINTRTGWYSSSVTGATDEAVDAGGDSSGWGGAPISLPRIQGADVVGEVVAAGSEADRSLIGKRVMVDCWLRDWDNPLDRTKTGYVGSECDGGFSGFMTVDYRNAVPVSSPMSDAELATFACSYSTAEGMLTRAGVTAEDTVLVTGASGGVGSALTQLAGQRGARVVCLAGESKHAQIAELKPAAILPRAPADLASALEEVIGQRSVSVVADIVGGGSFPQLIDVLERGGRYTCSGAIAGPMVELDLRTLYLRDLTFTGSTVLPPETFRTLVGYIERGGLRPLVAATYPLFDIAQAQKSFSDKKHVGNIVMLPWA